MKESSCYEMLLRSWRSTNREHSFISGSDYLIAGDYLSSINKMAPLHRQIGNVLADFEVN
ncbi:hypothetical protein C9994_11215 [Marivirga lumbricoides]|uniref:Uncharacterized protein n=1 Tax=Marivirga lumbricoides TaxID=1046115 RepID=A0A2T4DNZ5_9BACT|nr:hypothetical protein C9994_11215 [Marivirga lumbricoides]